MALYEWYLPKLTSAGRTELHIFDKLFWIRQVCAKILGMGLGVIKLHVLMQHGMNRSVNGDLQHNIIKKKSLA